jgi:hypothetical protein
VSDLEAQLAQTLAVLRANELRDLRSFVKALDEKVAAELLDLATLRQSNGSPPRQAKKAKPSR